MCPPPPAAAARWRLSTAPSCRCRLQVHTLGGRGMAQGARARGEREGAWRLSCRCGRMPHAGCRWCCWLLRAWRLRLLPTAAAPAVASAVTSWPAACHVARTPPSHPAAPRAEREAAPALRCGEWSNGARSRVMCAPLHPPAPVPDRPLPQPQAISLVVPCPRASRVQRRRCKEPLPMALVRHPICHRTLVSRAHDDAQPMQRGEPHRPEKQQPRAPRRHRAGHQCAPPPTGPAALRPAGHPCRL
ncbi:hypothetical protein FA09DRAFT_56550 [Tilletiopsis washingtonensis]|uniref:Uncharacterized protein n=1 Tax=Tilletiopsis washingtonensis TaxID=58919 RepID=A0A316Z8A2_9BASI|nr:hypothetical protein FA09DRAFT_56550 [Tilletiopsis washingtonensis]PWN97486.1 hypothetical protein FA09DRAFT_56550 [Tilletiopsis washingtonensis]